jgi:site-specific DNA-adenine methylase
MIKWRGIKTTQEPKNENSFKTIINRFGQKSISLPRIDDQKRLAGYPGLTGVARKIALILDNLPSYSYYVEPFAGMAKVYQMMNHLNHNLSILNDVSSKVCDWLIRELKNDKTIISNLDFVECIKKYDDINTVFLIDPPWFKSYYDQVFSCFNREKVEDYNKQVIDLCTTLKGKFIITTRKENKTMLKSGFTNRLIESEYVVCGKYSKVLITTNISHDILFKYSLSLETFK